MRWIAILFLSASVTATATNAQADDGIISGQCLESITTTEEFRTQCIGMVTAGCSQDPAFQGPDGMVTCLQRERFAWDGLLNARYKQLRKYLDEPQKAELKKAQLAWIAERDARCGFEGSLAARIAVEDRPHSEALCLRDQTAMRALLLTYWRNFNSAG